MSPGRGDLGVLETKLMPPFQRPGLVRRQGLIDRMAALEEPVVAVLAPAGYGKSTVLSQWADTTDRPVAWLSADTRDSDPATLLRGMTAAIDRASGLDRSVIDAVAAPGQTVWASAIPRLGAALAAKEPFLMVVDDIDHIHDREALDVLVTLSGFLGPESRMAVAGRGAGEFPVARLASRGQLATIGRDSLTLELHETHSLVEAAGASLTGNEIQALHDRTEGWAAGIYLWTLSARTSNGAGAPMPVPSNAGDRLIEDYLRSEVLASMATEDADLLLRASVLDRISGPLCDDLLGRRGSGAGLDRLERVNLFLIPLDRDRVWFRFHHLLSELLRTELDRREPGAARELRRRAAIWHEEHGMPEIALEYAFTAHDETRAARLTSTLAQSALNDGRVETVRRWFGWFEDQWQGPNDPRLAAQATMAFALDGDLARAERWFGHATGRPSGRPEQPVTGITAVARALICQSGVAGMRADADAAIRTLADDDPFFVPAVGLAALGAMLAGDLDDGERGWHDTLEAWERAGTSHIAAILAHVHLAVLAIDRGDWTRGAEHARGGRSIALAHGIVEQAATAAVDAVSARIAIHHGATEQARSDAIHARRLRTLLTAAVPWLAVRVRLDLIRVDLAFADAGGARTLLAEVREILTRIPDMGTLVTEAADLERRVTAIRGGVVGASTLTMAELRLLPLLTTHLSFREIGERLFVSQNTVKTQAISIYRKLEASSRSEAVKRAIGTGLLDGPIADPAVQPG